MERHNGGQSVDLERHTSHSLMCALAGGSQHRRAVVGCKRRREELPRFIPSRGLQLRVEKKQSGLWHVVFVFRMRFMEMGVLCKAYKSNLQHPNTLQSRAHTETLTQSGVTSVLPFSISWHRRSSLRGSFQGKAFHERYLAVDGFRPSPSCPGEQGNRRLLERRGRMQAA